MTQPFDPARHRLGPSRYFEDFALGEVEGEQRYLLRQRKAGA